MKDARAPVAAPRPRKPIGPTVGALAVALVFVGALAAAGGWHPWSARPAPLRAVAAAPPAPPPATPPAPAATPPAPAPVAPPVTEPPRVHRPSPVVPVERGYLSIDSEPWSSAWLAGRRIGTTPFLRMPVAAGRHRVELDVQDSGRRKTVMVTVRPGRETRKLYRLK